MSSDEVPGGLRDRSHAVNYPSVQRIQLLHVRVSAVVELIVQPRSAGRQLTLYRLDCYLDPLRVEPEVRIVGTVIMTMMIIAMSVLFLIVPVLILVLMIVSFVVAILVFVMCVAVFVFVVFITILVVALALMIFVMVMSFVVLIAMLVLVVVIALFALMVFVVVVSFVVLIAMLVLVVVIMPAAEFSERNRIDPIRQLHYRLGALRRVANQVVQPRLLETQSHNENYIRVGDIGDIASTGLEVMRIRLAGNQ